MKTLVSLSSIAFATPLFSIAHAQATSAQKVETIAGCYALGDSTGAPIRTSFRSPVRLDTTPVQLETDYLKEARIVYGIRTLEPLDSTADRRRPLGARRVAFWYLVSKDSVVLHTKDKFTSHQFRLHLSDTLITGIQKYESDAYDPGNPPQWVGATARRVTCQE